MFSMFSRRPPARDIDTFLARYPDLPSADEEDKSWDRNLRFYMGEEHCEPDEMLIDEVHKEWATDYDTLEYNHGYIQWLFPIREHGMNFDAQPLQLHEIRAMKSNEDVMKRIKRSYKMMLGFYGMRLMDEKTGLLRRSSEFKPRYKNLMYAPHNNLRITRICKCLSELGLEHLSAGLILHVLNEQTEHGHLRTRTLMDSMDRYWVNCIRDDYERDWLNTLIERVRSRRLDFDREDYERVLDIRKIKGHFLWHIDSGEEGQEEGAEEEEEQEEEPSVEPQPGPSSSRKRSRDRECPPDTEAVADDRTRKRQVKNFTSAAGHDDDFTFNNTDDEWPEDLWNGREDESDDDNVLQGPGQHKDPESSKRLDESLHSLEETHQAPVTALLDSNLGEKEGAEDLPDYPAEKDDSDYPPETNSEAEDAEESRDISPKATQPPKSPNDGYEDKTEIEGKGKVEGTVNDEDKGDPKHEPEAGDEDDDNDEDEDKDEEKGKEKGKGEHEAEGKEKAEEVAEGKDKGEDETEDEGNGKADGKDESEGKDEAEGEPNIVTKSADQSTVPPPSSAEQSGLNPAKSAEEKKPSEPELVVGDLHDGGDKRQ